MKLEELQKGEKYEKVMVYGNSGAGKTVFASSFPGPIYFCDFDGKISSAASYLSKNNPDKIKEIEFDDFTDKTKAKGLRPYQSFLKKLEELEKDTKAGKYKTVVIDSLTTLSDAMMEEIMASNPGIKGPVPGVPGMQHYLLLSFQFKQLIKRLLAMPCNVVMLGHIKVDKDEVTSRIVYRPMLSGQLPEQIPILLEEVYRAYVETKDGKTSYLAQTQAAGGYVARTQKQNIPSIIELKYESIRGK